MNRVPRMANWPPEVAWHERDVVVPVFRLWLEAQGWETETETAFVDVVARRGMKLSTRRSRAERRAVRGRDWTRCTASC